MADKSRTGLALLNLLMLLVLLGLSAANLLQKKLCYSEKDLVDVAAGVAAGVAAKMSEEGEPEEPDAGKAHQ